jgi:hypothetical protein
MKTKQRWLTYGEVKRRIEACIGSDGKYTLSLWIQGAEPVLPRHYFKGRKWAAYDAEDVARLLEPMKQESRSTL